MGLASIIANHFQNSFGGDFQASAVGVILINQMLGPVATKLLFQFHKEDGKADDTFKTNKIMFDTMMDDDNFKSVEIQYDLVDLECGNCSVIFESKYDRQEVLNPLGMEMNDREEQKLPSIAAVTIAPEIVTPTGTKIHTNKNGYNALNASSNIPPLSGTVATSGYSYSMMDVSIV